MGVLERFRLDGKRLFITGGSRGLGREMALGLAEAGADVILVGREASSLDQTAADVRARGRQAFTISADVGRPEGAERACRTALAEYPPIDILINTSQQIRAGYEIAKDCAREFSLKLPMLEG